MGKKNKGEVMELRSGRIPIWGILLLAGATAGAQSSSKSFPMSVNTSVSGESAAAAPASGMVTRSGNSKVTLRIINSCFPTNLRSVANPVDPNAQIDATVKVHIGSQDYEFKASYIGETVARGGGVISGDAAAVGLPGATVNGAPISAGTNGSVVVFNSAIPSSMTVAPDGTVTEADKGSVYLISTSFNQTILTCSGGPVYGTLGYSSRMPTYPCGQFMGKAGPMTASIGGLSVSADKSVLELNVSFPGQTGFCGGYWSPLMVFFDDARPQFTNVSTFPLSPTGRTTWPEANSPGWFVAIDDGTGTITKKDQLFGDTEKFKNGFEALKALDSNHDGVIDKRDKDFKKLVLWRDVDGDGVSQKREVVKLSSKIVKISLDYDMMGITDLSARAQARERSKFWFKDGKGKMKVGSIVDVWFAPAPPQQLTQK